MRFVVMQNFIQSNEIKSNMRLIIPDHFYIDTLEKKVLKSTASLHSAVPRLHSLSLSVSLVGYVPSHSTME